MNRSNRLSRRKQRPVPFAVSIVVSVGFNLTALAPYDPAVCAAVMLVIALTAIVLAPRG